MPEDELQNSGGGDGVEAKCQLCNEAFTAHRYLYTHLSDNHFKQELDNDLPKSAPWKCPSDKEFPKVLKLSLKQRECNMKTAAQPGSQAQPQET